jgi:hypothetical protein
VNPQEWKVISDFAGGLTVVAVLVIDLYVVIIGKLVTRGHLDDVVAGLEQRNTDLLGERDRAVEREEQARRELAENTTVMNRLDSTVREALQALARRR